MPRRLLIIEDDPEIADLAALHLRGAGYEVETRPDGESGLARLAEAPPAAVILDLGLPGELDGLEVCRRIRAREDYLPLVMVTARGEETDRIVGLEVGADDYVTKPFSVRELVARVKALLRRQDAGRNPAAARIECGGIVIEPERRRVTVEGRAVELTPKEFDLLLWFAEHPGRVFTRADLLDRVWGYGYEGYAHTVNSHINRLRVKIEADPSDPRYVLTVWGVGYKFTDAPGS